METPQEAKPHGLKTGKIAELKLFIQELVVRKCQLEEAVAGTQDRLREITLTAEIELTDKKTQILQAKLATAEKRALGGKKGGRGHGKESQKETADATQARLSAALSETAEERQRRSQLQQDVLRALEGGNLVSDIQEAVAKQQMRENAASSSGSAPVAGVAENQASEEAGAKEPELLMTPKKHASTPEQETRLEKCKAVGKKLGALGGCFGKMGGRPLKRSSEIDEAIKELPQRLRYRPKMRRGSGQYLNPPDLASKLHFCWDHEKIWHLLEERGLADEARYWKWQSGRTGMEAKDLRAILEQKAELIKERKRSGIGLTKGYFRAHGERSAASQYSKNLSKKTGVRQINPENKPGQRNVWGEVYKEIKVWFDQQRMRQNYVDQADLWRQFKVRVKTIIQKLQKKKDEELKALTYLQTTTLRRGISLLSATDSVSCPKHAYQNRQKWRITLMSQVDAKNLMPNREVNLTLEEEEARILANWRAHDKKFELAAFGTEEQLKPYVRDPKAFIANRHKLVFEQRDQVWNFWEEASGKL